MLNAVLFSLLADAAAVASGPNLSLFYGVLVLGFIAAVTLGSVAFYNSKRPVGWEDKERPKVVPKVGDEESS